MSVTAAMTALMLSAAAALAQGGPGGGGPGGGGRGGMRMMGGAGKIVKIEANKLTLEFNMQGRQGGGGGGRATGLVPAQGGGGAPTGPIQVGFTLDGNTKYRQVAPGAQSDIAAGCIVVCVGTGDTCSGIGVYKPAQGEEGFGPYMSARALLGPLMVAVGATQDNVPNQITGSVKSVNGNAIVVTMRSREGEQDATVQVNPQTKYLKSANSEHKALEVGRYASVAPSMQGFGGGAPGGPGGGGGGGGRDAGFQPMQGGGAPGGGGGMPQMTAATVTQMPAGYAPPNFPLGGMGGGPGGGGGGGRPGGGGGGGRG